MLILIVGVTGMCGQACARAAFNAGHQVRGLARNPERLSQAITAGLESFVKWKDVYDIEALDKAVKGVDAIISAAHPTPTAIVDGQILLLRAAERAGVKVFGCEKPQLTSLLTDLTRYFTPPPGTMTGPKYSWANAKAMTPTSLFATTRV